MQELTFLAERIINHNCFHHYDCHNYQKIKLALLFD